MRHPPPTHLATSPLCILPSLSRVQLPRHAACTAPLTYLAPPAENRVDVAYPEITDVIVVGRGVGLWGDMVITLRDGSKVELRSVEKFMEIRDYIRARVDEIKASSPGVGSGGVKDKN